MIKLNYRINICAYKQKIKGVTTCCILKMITVKVLTKKF